jgi:hypothetical protein
MEMQPVKPKPTAYEKKLIYKYLLMYCSCFESCITF